MITKDNLVCFDKLTPDMVDEINSYIGSNESIAFSEGKAIAYKEALTHIQTMNKVT